MSTAIPIFDPPSPHCHTLSPFVLTPSPLVTTQIVINFELIMSRPLMQLLDLIFAKICIFSTQTLLSTWKATLKSRWVDVITTFKVIWMRLLKQYFFEVVSSLFGLTPYPLSHFLTILLDHPSPWAGDILFECPLTKCFTDMQYIWFWSWEIEKVFICKISHIHYLYDDRYCIFIDITWPEKVF